MFHIKGNAIETLYPKYEENGYRDMNNQGLMQNLKVYKWTDRQKNEQTDKKKKQTIYTLTYFACLGTIDDP